MKARIRRIREGKKYMSRDEQVRSEIQSFLQALDSYPKRFLQEPKISFEEHRRSIGEVKVRTDVDENRSRRPARA
jgi:hypothetical protein